MAIEQVTMTRVRIPNEEFNAKKKHTYIPPGEKEVPIRAKNN